MDHCVAVVVTTMDDPWFACYAQGAESNYKCLIIFLDALLHHPWDLIDVSVAFVPFLGNIVCKTVEEFVVVICPKGLAVGAAHNEFDVVACCPFICLFFKPPSNRQCG
jgi:hypothetical protein